MDREEEEESEKEWEGNNMRAKEMDERTLNGWEKLENSGRFSRSRRRRRRGKGRKRRSRKPQIR